MSGHTDLKLHDSLGSELDGVREQVPKDLLDALRVAFKASGQLGTCVDLEIQLL